MILFAAERNQIVCDCMYDRMYRVRVHTALALASTLVTNKSKRYFSHLFLWFRFDDSIKDNFSSSFILIRMSLAALEALRAQGTEDDTIKKK